MSTECLKLNLIGSKATRNKLQHGDFDWEETASRELAQKIRNLMQKDQINIRIVQFGDNLGRIGEGLSQAVNGFDWSLITVEYRGTSEEINEQKIRNIGTLKNAHVLYKNQYVYWKNASTLVVAATLDDIDIKAITNT